ncbi:MAG: hypothetical protein VXY10_02070 [Candidatus Thermoplasmatota archaeon]|nr:hypothetical protein [Candidatus Thermoplasmatota archaeon]MEC8680690.1 hypothetical protein [Candidatus Thermoplasmatota archaeon]
MVTWADADAAVEAERAVRIKRVENATLVSALTLLLCAVWLAWPSIRGLSNGDGVVLASFGAPLLVLIWGIFVQDLTLDDGAARSRVASATSVAWPLLMCLGALGFEGDVPAMAGSGLVLLSGVLCRQLSHRTMRGNFGVLRYRAILTGIGTLSALALTLTAGETLNQPPMILALGISAFAMADTAYTWTVGDDQKAERKRFRQRLDRLETRLLELKAQGAAVAQAASLLTTAKEEGHLDPDYGMRLLDESEEDMERALSFADDVEIIRQDALTAVEAAESIAPTVKRPRKAYEMGEREVKLGSLREGEQLYRQAKKRASETVMWWAKAEEAILEATRALDGKDGAGANQLREVLSEAKAQLAREQPKEAYEIAIVILPQLDADADVIVRAEQSVEEAVRSVAQSDGLDTSEMEARLEQASEALASGNASQAIGLADGVVRTLERERAAMDDVLRALKQKKKLKQRYEGREDKDRWEAMLNDIVAAADDRIWSHAAMLLEQMTTALDRDGHALEEARELYDFVAQQWAVLRNQCEAAHIKATDEDRRAVEEAVAKAEAHLGVARLEEALDSLGVADGAMERLRRRI